MFTLDFRWIHGICIYTQFIIPHHLTQCPELHQLAIVIHLFGVPPIKRAQIQIAVRWIKQCYWHQVKNPDILTFFFSNEILIYKLVLYWLYGDYVGFLVWSQKLAKSQRKSFYSNLNGNFLFERGFDTHCVWLYYAQWFHWWSHCEKKMC